MRVLCLVAILLFCGVAASAQTTYNAASCSSSDIATAVASAVSGGHSSVIIAIPSGTCTWTASLTSPASGSLPATVVFQGQTTVSCSGTPGTSGYSCTATDNTTIQQSNGSGVWYILPSAGSTVTFENLTLTSTGTVTNGMVNLQGPGSGTVPNVRVTQVHANMTSNADTALSIATVYGVIDHSRFDEETSSEGNAIRFYWPWGGDSGDQSWNNATGIGTSVFMFVENSMFNHGVANDGQEGARFVFRYNALNDTSVQTHPTGGDGRGRGARAWEIYNNAFTATGGCSVECGNSAFLSSGTGMVWGNSANSVYSQFIGLHSMRKDSSTYTQTATPAGWGYCGTNFNGTGSNWDENTPATNGYRCLDQPGSGVGQLITGSFPSVTNASTGTIAWPNQALEPIYEWLNSWTGTTGNYWTVDGEASTCSPSCTGGNLLQSNRDYYLWCNASSNNGCTSAFNGTAGTGSGLLSARPSTCTTTVGYWATDTQTLYLCETTNTWTAYYTPYTYPHPLDIASAAAIAGSQGNIANQGSTSIQ